MSPQMVTGAGTGWTLDSCKKRSRASSVNDLTSGSVRGVPCVNFSNHASRSTYDFSKLIDWGGAGGARESGGAVVDSALGRCLFDDEPALLSLEADVPVASALLVLESSMLPSRAKMKGE